MLCFFFVKSLNRFFLLTSICDVAFVHFFASLSLSFSSLFLGVLHNLKGKAPFFLVMGELYDLPTVSLFSV